MGIFNAAQQSHPDEKVRAKSELTAWKLAKRVGADDVELGVGLVQVQRVRMTAAADTALAGMYALPAATVPAAAPERLPAFEEHAVKALEVASKAAEEPLDQAEEPDDKANTQTAQPPAGDGSDESTNPEVGSATYGSAPPPRPDTRETTAISLSNDRRAAYAEHLRREVAAAWWRSRSDASPLTAEELAAKYDTTVRILRDAVAKFPAPSGPDTT
ncbi:hypothetical protein ACWF95_38960 [Streptomyces vinaceus]